MGRCFWRGGALLPLPGTMRRRAPTPAGVHCCRGGPQRRCQLSSLALEALLALQQGAQLLADLLQHNERRREVQSAQRRRSLMPGTTHHERAINILHCMWPRSSMLHRPGHLHRYGAFNSQSHLGANGRLLGHVALGIRSQVHAGSPALGARPRGGRPLAALPPLLFPPLPLLAPGPLPPPVPPLLAAIPLLPPLARRPLRRPPAYLPPLLSSLLRGPGLPAGSHCRVQRVDLSLQARQLCPDRLQLVPQLRGLACTPGPACPVCPAENVSSGFAKRHATDRETKGRAPSFMS